MEMRDLGGHSGCRILLCETEKNRVFVRKISGNAEYNDRLKIQAEKQTVFNSSNVKTPKVLTADYTADGLFYFDMEYIQGITLAEHMKSIEIGKLRGLVKSIVDNIVPIREETSICNADQFTRKIAMLENELKSHNNKTIDEAISLLKFHSWERFLQTPCHGDLTLENIMVKDNQLYLIDFLDSFYDCWIMDISTLMQDVQTMWSYRYDVSSNINTVLRLIVFRDILMEMIKEKKPNDYLEVYYALLLKLLRIYPYVKDKITYDFLNVKTKSVINIIRREEKLCEH